MHLPSFTKEKNKLTHTHSHQEGESVEPVCKVTQPHKITNISTIDEFDQVLEDHHHRRVVVFCTTATYKDPDVDAEGWYHHYEKLHDVHFVRIDVDSSPPLEERLQPKTKPCWFTFHKGQETGWSSGGMKRFVQVHSERKGSH